ncbi:DNA polymerase III subunit [Apibacter adventoris]|uniref:DNA polymerase III subunit delta n=1 Tax=Apibacter adventoris TaxID=1679466 RepID=A0A2S8AGT9_9FLAO|nr:DNA polymerase III subunit delta' [Apibacter adventoris]PQL92497.1 DNA polymerase III subunit delta' [Apibacter adventoris]PQL95508.1 DNA polymerase III subunit delta' [Apibacter adventoris]
MKWEEVIGQDLIKQQLKDSIQKNRISHAQLFIGKSGYGVLPLVLAYASEILCKDSQSCYKQVSSLQHPDLFFSFPTINNATEKKEAVSKDYITKFREFITENPYQSINQWYEFLGEDKKQGFISVKEIENIFEKLNLKSFEGGYKIQIIWMMETMRTEAANKLLKILEEPPTQTIFLLITEDESKILPTILSRCQAVKINRIEEKEITKGLKDKYSLSEDEINKISTKVEGDWNLAVALQKNNELQEEFERYFIQWNRAAVMAPKQPVYLKQIVEWSIEISGWGREKQKTFLQFCTEIFRQALLENYASNILVNTPLTYKNFKWQSFSQFVHGNNIEDIINEINKAYFHIERNGNPKIIFLDMGVKLTRYLARKKD